MFCHYFCSHFGILHKVVATRAGPGPGPSEQVDPRLLEKTDLLLNLTVMVKSLFLTKCRMLISNISRVFSNSSQIWQFLLQSQFLSPQPYESRNFEIGKVFF